MAFLPAFVESSAAHSTTAGPGPPGPRARVQRAVSVVCTPEENPPPRTRGPGTLWLVACNRARGSHRTLSPTRHKRQDEEPDRVKPGGRRGDRAGLLGPGPAMRRGWRLQTFHLAIPDASSTMRRAVEDSAIPHDASRRCGRFTGTWLTPSLPPEQRRI